MKKSIVSVVIVCLVLALFTWTALFGLNLGFYEVEPLSEGVVLGLDLVGGSEITYEAAIPAGTSGEDAANALESAQTMLRQRLNALGYTEANVYLSGETRIVVEIPDVDDPETAVQQLGTTAVVEFQDADGKVLLEGNSIAKASYVYGPVDNTGMSVHHVVLSFTEEGRKAFTAGTKTVASRTDGKNYLSIVMDGETISAPTVDPGKFAATGIDTETAVITMGNASAEEASYLANIISAGKLPFALECVKLQAVGATLGERSLESSLLASAIGLALVCLFMLIVYRVMGVVSCIALAVYVAAFGVIISMFHLNLSLPGIAGIILTIGMAVDANVVIYERIKEELRVGKTLRFAIDAGYRRAVTAIIDSNITTIIAALVLLINGTGTILSFAQTLLIGVILSMVVMLLFTRILLKAAVGFKITSPKAYCV